jgi:hypothetical protein
MGDQSWLSRLLLGKAGQDMAPAELFSARQKRFDTVFKAECEALHRGDTAATPPLSALCFSGGGIRSATFALGILQTLARHGILFQFDYISTVSGGGYIGSFLSAWRHRATTEDITAGLCRTSACEASEIVGLRDNSNYLTPRLGVLSADTWTALALIVRNLLLNWLVFLPFFMCVLLVPWVCDHALEALRHIPDLSTILLWVGWGALGTGLTTASYARRRAEGVWVRDRGFVCTSLLPIGIAAGAFTIAASTGQTIPLQLGPLAGMACYASAFLIASVLLWLTRTDATAVPRRSGSETFASESFAKDFAVWILSGAVAGGVLELGMRAAPGLAVALQTSLGLGWTMLAIFAGELVFIALRSYDLHGDMDREWFARAAGWLTSASLAWGVLSAVALYGPWVSANIWHQAALLAAGGVSGIVTLVLGSSAQTAATTARQLAGKLSPTQIASVAGVIFAICLAIAISALNAWAEPALRSWLQPTPSEFLAGYWFAQPLWDTVFAAGLLLFSIGVSYCVNINRFSLHGLYRNRLVRAFLGSARQGAHLPRTPDPFTGFDPHDNPRMDSLKKIKPLHVVNMALNVVSTRNLAWQERKAASFTVTPLHCGCPLTGYRPTGEYGSMKGGITLGTAMAISGAAVSPNMGYHSSPVVGFLLMLFNLRLGCWLGNPGRDGYDQEGPKIGLFTMLAELANRTTADGKWIYLSDGGHFDNLGLYEMIRRGCRDIVVSDAGCDPDAGLADLGDSIRKISIDFGVTITFGRLDPVACARPPKTGLSCWIGTIAYPGGAPAGRILYIRPNFTGLETPDIRAYAQANPSFPHESTSEQWFGESQFEAYRALGAHEMETICSGAAPGAPAAANSLDTLFARAKAIIEPITPAPEPGVTRPDLPL